MTIRQALQVWTTRIEPVGLLSCDRKRGDVSIEDIEDDDRQTAANAYSASQLAERIQLGDAIVGPDPEARARSANGSLGIWIHAT